MNKMFAHLDMTTSDIPIEQMLTELQVVVERFSFYEMTHESDAPIDIDMVQTLLGDDVSSGVFSFVEWAADHNILRLFTGNNGQLFLSYCTRHYKTVPEVVIATPITLDTAKRRELTERLRLVHPLPARLIFKTSPSLLVGCTITNGDSTRDYSLKRTMLSNIRQHAENTLALTGGSDG